MENKLVLSFDVKQVAAALEDAGFEASERNVTAIAEYIKDGGESIENFAAAFRTRIADVAADLKLGRARKSKCSFRSEDWLKQVWAGVVSEAVPQY
jgi:hypothetical protein